MCEHCGCQALQTVQELTREHEVVLGHLRELSLALTAGDDVRPLCLELLRVLAPHTAGEEEALLPAMAAEHPEHVAVLRAEHDLVHRALQEAAVAGPVPRLAHALQVLREHIAKEQDGLFPAALISLSAEQWERAEQVRRRVRSALVAAGAR